MTTTRRLAVFLSGGGRTLANLFERIDSGDLEAKIGLVLSNRADAFGLERARERGVAIAVLDPDRHLDDEAFSRAAFALCEAADCGTVVLAGFLRILRVPPSWSGRVLNVHPSLLPAFGGRGFYGMRVHRAVKEAAVRETGCTVHLVTDEVDAGPILLQRRVPVLPADTPEDIAARVFEEEKLALPAALRAHLAERDSFERGPAARDFADRA